MRCIEMFPSYTEQPIFWLIICHTIIVKMSLTKDRQIVDKDEQGRMLFILQTIPIPLLYPYSNTLIRYLLINTIFEFKLFTKMYP